MDAPSGLVAALVRPLFRGGPSATMGDGSALAVMGSGPTSAAAAATLGLSLAVYRCLRVGACGDGDGGGAGGVLLPLLRVALFGRKSAEEDGADAYYRAAHGGRGSGSRGRGCGSGSGRSPEAEPEPETQHRGACHCESIRFTLTAPRHVRAVDCAGRIRYPHHPTTADKFQLTKGSRHLKMYYVNVRRQLTATEGAGAGGDASTVMAAHTFCGRCGVHIVRAPDSNLDALEVNVGCLEEVDCGTGGRGQARSPRGARQSPRRLRASPSKSPAVVTVDPYPADASRGIGLSAGTALPHQWLEESASQLDDRTHGPLCVDDLSTFWPTEDAVGLGIEGELLGGGEEGEGTPGQGAGRLGGGTPASTEGGGRSGGMGAGFPPRSAGALKTGGNFFSPSMGTPSMGTPSTSASTVLAEDVGQCGTRPPSRVVYSHAQSELEAMSVVSAADLMDDLTMATMSIGGASLERIGEGAPAAAAEGGSGQGKGQFHHRDQNQNHGHFGGGHGGGAIGRWGSAGGIPGDMSSPSGTGGMTAPGATALQSSSSVNRDQLKYYMRRHLQTPSPSIAASS